MNILLISTTNRNFPLDIEPEFKKAGHSIERLSSLEDFLCCAKRYQPFLAIFEIGSKEDYDKAFTTYDWMERIQPTAPSRYLLLIASKHLELRDKLIRFSSAEIAYLPSPMKSLLFKAELQVRLLKQKQVQPEGFTVSSDPYDLKNDRVMVLKGPNPEQGQWKPDEFNPTGKIRWRWVSLEENKIDAQEPPVSWVAESPKPPVFKTDPPSWELEEEQADIKGLHQEKEVFSARKVKKILKNALEKDPTFLIPQTELAIEEKRKTPEINKLNPTGALENAPAKIDKVQQETISKPAASNPSAKQGGFSTPGVVAPATSTFNQTLSTPTDRSEPILKTESLSNQVIENKIQTESRREGNIHLAQKSERAIVDGQLPPQNAIREKNNRTLNSEPIMESGKNKIEQLNIPQTGQSAVASLSEVKTKESITSVESVPLRSEKQNTATKLGSENRPLTIDVQEKGRAVLAPQDSTAALKNIESNLQTGERKLSPSEKELAPTKIREELSGARSELDKKDKSNEGVSSNNNSAPNLQSSPLELERKARRENTLERTLENEKNKKSETQDIEGEKPWEPIRFEERVESNRSADPASKISGNREIVDVQRVEGTKKSEEDSGFLLTRHQITMTLTELNDHESSWHPVDQYRIYLSAKHRYYGVKDIADIFPLWIYEGELAPEFLESKKMWRFYDRAPRPYHSLEALPLPVFEFFSHFPAVQNFVDEKKKAFQTQNIGAKNPTAAPPEKEKPQRRKRGFWSFLKNLFWKS